MGFLEIYLIGALLTGGTYHYKSCPTKVLSNGECATVSAVIGVSWPVYVPYVIYSEVVE